MIRTIWCAIVILPATAVMAILSIVLTVFTSRGRGYHVCAIVWSNIILWTAGVKVKVYGLDKIDFQKCYLFASNHCSAFDIPVVITAIPNQIRLVAKKELAKVPFMGWSLRMGDYILIDRTNRNDSMKSLDDGVDKLHNGRSVLMFAEGTRSVSGEIKDFKKGPFLLAIKAQVPVVPITINYTQNIMVKNTLKIKSGTVEIHISKPIETWGMTEDDRQKLLDDTHTAVKRNHKLSI